MSARDWWAEPPDLVPLDEHHDRQSFTCGQPAMDDFLRTAPLTPHTELKVWVAIPYPGTSEILAYYAMRPDPIDLVSEEESVSLGVVTVVAVERIATDIKYQGQGLGDFLLATLFEQVLDASEVHPIEALTLVPLNERVRAWYLRLGFLPVPDHEGLFIPLATLRQARTGRHSEQP